MCDVVDLQLAMYPFAFSLFRPFVPSLPRLFPSKNTFKILFFHYSFFNPKCQTLRIFSALN